MDHFKTINDSLGHDVGDKALKEVAQCIQNICTSSRVVARLGGDEFVVVGKEMKAGEDSVGKMQELAEGLLAVLKEPYIIDHHRLYLSASIGVSLIEKTHLNANAFLKEADIAMYEAKKSGRDGVIVFNKELEESVNYKLEIEQRLYSALNMKKIDLYYQVQVNSHSEVIGCEALARWRDNDLGEVSPHVFIPIAERTGLIIEIGAYMLRKVFKTAHEWEERGVPLIQLSVNISVRQLLHSSFVEDTKHLIDTYRTPESKIKMVFEITESILVTV